MLDGTVNTFVYDLSTDIAERQDLASRRQDIARELRPLLDAWEKDVDAEYKASTATPASSPPK